MALTARMWFEYSPGCWVFARAITAIVAVGTLYMINMYNESICQLDSILELWYRYTTEFVRHTQRRAGPVVVLGLILSMLVVHDFTFSFSRFFKKVQHAGTTMTPGPADAPVIPGTMQK